MRFISFLILCSTSIAVAVTPTSTLETRTVTMLDQDEPWEAMTHHAGNLWVGKSRDNHEIKYSIEVYDAKGEKLLAKKELTHTLGFLYPYSSSQVIAVGKKADPWTTYYSILSFQKGAIVSKTVQLPEVVQVEHFAGDPLNMFFTEVGDRAIYQWKNSRLKKLDVEISGPGMSAFTGSELYVLERKSFTFGDENIVRIDLKTQEATRLFAADRNGLNSLKYFPSVKLLGATEYNADQALLVDGLTGEIAATMPVPGGPRGMVAAGHCIAVSAEATQKIHWFDAAKKDAPEVAVWDLSSFGDSLKQPRNMGFDPQSATLFVRSTYPCMGCTLSMSSVVSARDASGDFAKACLD